MADTSGEDAYRAAYAEMASLKQAVSGVVGSAIAGVDGLLAVGDSALLAVLGGEGLNIPPLAASELHLSLFRRVE